MRIAWTLNSSTRRYLRSFSPPWPVLHHLQPYDGTSSPQYCECEAGQSWSLCNYLQIPGHCPHSVHMVVGILVKKGGCYNSVYFEEHLLPLNSDVNAFGVFTLSFIARCRQIEKHTIIFQIAIRQNSKQNCWLSYSTHSTLSVKRMQPK